MITISSTYRTINLFKIVKINIKTISYLPCMFIIQNIFIQNKQYDKTISNDQGNDKQ